MTEKRVSVTYSFEAEGEDGELPPAFRLVRLTEHQARRQGGEWHQDRAADRPYATETVATLSRDALAGLIARGADALSWGPND